MSGMEHKSGTLFYFREIFTLIRTKKTSFTIAVRCSWKRCWCRKSTLFGFMLWWNCVWGVVF